MSRIQSASGDVEGNVFPRWLTNRNALISMIHRDASDLSRCQHQPIQLSKFGTQQGEFPHREISETDAVDSFVVVGDCIQWLRRELQHVLSFPKCLQRGSNQRPL